MVEAYLQYPLDPDAQDLALISVVYEETACLDVLRLLFEATATLECRDDTGATPLLLTSDWVVVRELKLKVTILKKPCYILYRCIYIYIYPVCSLDLSSLTLNSNLGEDGNLEATRLLIEAKADLQALDDDVMTPLCAAASNDHVEVAHLKNPNFTKGAGTQIV